MRLIALLAIMLSAISVAPARELGWNTYRNARFEFIADVPQGYFARAGSDEGQEFFHERTGRVLWVSGSPITESSFEAQIAPIIANGEREGWAIAYRAVAPRWARLTAVMGARRLHMQMIELCDRTSFAQLILEYSAQDAADIRPTLDRLDAGLRTTTPC